MPTPRAISFASIGECLVELMPIQSDVCQYQLKFGGDTNNTAIYLARCLAKDKRMPKVTVDYVTALGTDDPFSQMMRTQWGEFGLGLQMVRSIPHKLPGLYVIQTDAFGERRFYYYRGESCAKFMFDGVEGRALAKRLLGYDYLYFSSITLAILTQESLGVFLDILQQAKARHISLIFDTNYRELLWASKSEAISVINQVLPLVNVALPSLEDEQRLFGDKDEKACAARLHGLGVEEVVVKMGSQGYFLSTAKVKELVVVEAISRAVDTTAAGDSFNGAYLAKRFCGDSIQAAAAYAALVVKQVIQYPGAILPKEVSMP